MKTKMKKFVTLALAIIMIISCTACNKNTPAEDTVSTTNQTIQDENQDKKIPDFLNAPAADGEIEGFRKEVLNRLKALEKDEDAKFSTPEEIKFLEENGFTLSRRGLEMAEYDESYMELTIYNYPVVYKTEDSSVQVWALTQYGELYIRTIIDTNNRYSYSDYLGNVHPAEMTENESIIRDESGFAVVYDEKENEVTFWSMGNVICQHTVPEGSVYCGFSDWVGYIFRAGTDVYALSDVGTISANNKETCDLRPIAHNVQMVIDADYYMGSDDWAQPLFLMTDGTVKGYCEWVGDRDATSDDSSHLYDIRYEGGYDK